MYSSYNSLYTSYLYHSGIKGMKWGVRRKAKKDAKEYTKAKSFYGEGAGTRRKLIKQKVEYNSKHIPGYKEAFDHYVKNTDMSKRASQAVRERKVKDAKNSAGKAVRGVGNILAGRMQFVGGSMLIGYTALRIGQRYGYITSNEVLMDKAYNIGKNVMREFKNGGKH